MKRALVFSLIFALGIGVAGFAGAFTGDWDTSLCLDWDNSGVDPVIEFGSFVSSLYVDYAVSGWVLGSNLIFNNSGLSQMWFDAAGNFGAFSFTSIIEFAPAAATFTAWENIVEVSIAGVNFYGLFGIQGFSPVGVGMAFGAVAVAGDIDFGIEVQFGAGGSLYFVKLYGVQGAYGHADGWAPCGAYGFWTLGGWNGATSCDPGFTGLDLYVAFPFTCLDVSIFGGFSCDVGFKNVVVLLENIDIGAGWFNIDSLAITFQTSGKALCMDLDLTLGDAVCVTPYLSIVTTGGQAYVPDTAYIVDGIALNALTLNYNYNGVTFKAGEIFHHEWERESGWINAMTMCDGMLYKWYFSPTGGITRYSGCAFRVLETAAVVGPPAVPAEYTYPNEMFGLSIDGDSCCGGGFSVDLYNFLYAGGTPGQFGIFGWVGSYGAISVDIGTAFTIGANATVSYKGMEELCFNFGFSW